MQSSSERQQAEALVIRACVDADLSALCDIYNHYIANTVISFEVDALTPAEMGTRVAAYTQQYPWLVCEVDGVLAGYAYACRWQERSAYRHSVMSSIYLRHTETGKGLGKALYGALLCEVAKLDCHAIVAGIALPNAASVGLHEHFGFVKTAHFPEVGRKFGQWVDVGYWQLTFTD